ncbi:MAG: ATP-binding protein [Pseudomonadota bacterium]
MGKSKHAVEIAESYAAVAAARAKGVGSRLGLAVFLAICAYILTPSSWPAFWTVAVFAGQGLDWLAFRSIRRRPGVVPDRAVRIGCFASTLLNTAVYSSMTVYTWRYGGDAGRLMAVIQVAGGLVHVSLQMHAHRRLLLAAAIPHAAYLLGLPTAAALGLGGRPEPVMIMGTVAGLLYLAHLGMVVKLNVGMTAALREARDLAERERERAESASASKSDFLATVSHEIRTPMNAVIGAAHLLRRTELAPDQAEHVAMLLSGADVLTGVINDVLDISKIEAGKLTLEVVDFPLVEKLHSLRQLWEPRAADKGIGLRLDLDPGLPAAVRGDPLRLQQILFNLLSNAVKFTDAGEVVLKAAVDERADGPRLVFRVTDSGCGMSPETVERVFASFEQAHAYTTRRHGGTGLGLTISRRLAEMMGGSLGAASTLGAGSTFTLEIPLIAAAAPVAPARESRQADEDGGRPLSVLLAEDHEVNRRIVSLFLQPLGWRLAMAEDGEQAVAMAGAEPFDVILMDMQMPAMDGLAASRAIRAGGPNAGTPIVALTANALDHHRAAWDEVGAAAFLSKPIDPRELVATLARAADGRPREAEARAVGT